MLSTHEAELDIPHLPLAARQVHIVPDLTSASLISMGQLCNAGCNVSFTASTVTVHYNNSIVLLGHRTPSTRLWHFDLPTHSPPPSPPPCTDSAHSAIGSATPAELVAFAHAALFSPSLSTLESALQKGFLPSFPGLSLARLRKYPPHSIPMVKGHLDQSRKNQRSTKSDLARPSPPTSPAPLSTPALPDVPFPSSDSPNLRSHDCFAAILEPTGQIYTDQTGRFVAPSSNGNNYLVIVYDYDSNCILAEPIPSRHAASILTGFQALHQRLCAAGLRPQLQRLDNECSVALKQFLRDESIDFQLAPPGVHRRNAAERAIRTFKNHFIAGLCSVDKEFPLHLWDRLLPQALLTLNLLRGSRINPRLSAWSQLFGHFDFNRTPIAPPGIRVLVHEKPTQRTTWSPHALDGWYVGPALDSYRCYTVWLWDSRAVRITDTVSWFPTKVTMPLASSTDLILAGLHDITLALQNPSPGSPLAPLTDSHVAALNQLTLLLTNLSSPPARPPLVPPTPDPPVPPLPNAAPSLRVDVPPVPPLGVPDSPVPPPVDPSSASIPSPVVTPIATYDKCTGLAGRRRRRRQKSAPARPVRIAAQSRHSHGTRANAKHLANSITNVPASPPLLDFFDDHFALHGNAFNPDTGQLAEYQELSQCSEGPLWIESCKDEFGRLCTGHGSEMKSGTETMFFIPYSAIPKGRKPTYLRIVAAFRPEKPNPRRIRFTVGGDRVDYAGDVSTKTADLSTVKLLLNSVISTPGFNRAFREREGTTKCSQSFSSRDSFE